MAHQLIWKPEWVPEAYRVQCRPDENSLKAKAGKIPLRQLKEKIVKKGLVKKRR